MRFLTMVLSCDVMGTIQKVILNNIPGLIINEHSMFLELFDLHNHDKVQNFFLNIAGRDTLTETDLVIVSQGKPLVLYFKGVMVDSDRLIIAESEFDEIVNFYSDMMQLNNQLVNALRETFKKSRLGTGFTLDNDKFLEELTKVNNDLITMQRELNKKNSELAKLNDLKNQFVSIAAHDLRNPLGIIFSYSHFLIDDMKGSLNATNLEFLQIIRSTSEYMLHLVESILDLTYIQSEKIKLRQELTNFSEIYEHSAKLMQSIAIKKGIQLEYEKAPAMTLVHIDIVKIKQVIMNIIGNAIKYSSPDSLIKLSLIEHPQVILFSCQDHGLGIPADDTNKIFEPFYRVGQIEPNGEKSAGLGLAISKNIVLAHKGQIWVESTIGEGSTFHFSIPKVAN